MIRPHSLVLGKGKTVTLMNHVSKKVRVKRRVGMQYWYLGDVNVVYDVQYIRGEADVPQADHVGKGLLADLQDVHPEQEHNGLHQLLSTG